MNAVALPLAIALTIGVAAMSGGAAESHAGDPSQDQQAGADRVSAGFNNTCALRSEAVWCWGNNGAGQSGDGTTTSHATPVPLPSLARGVTAISVGEIHSCAIKQGGLWCWGYNHDGELGIGTTVDSHLPVLVSGMESGVMAVSAGWFHTCAIKDGGAWCWGYNSPGAIGNAGVGLQTLLPVPVDGMDTGVTAISAGEYNTCAIKDGGAWCWGIHANGELGDGSTLTPERVGFANQSNIPVRVSGFDSGVTGISAGEFYVCAVKDGGVSCWGYDYSAPTETPGVLSNVPEAIDGMSAGVTAVTVGTNHVCAIKLGGLWCWGRDEQGQLGNGESGNVVVNFTPTLVPGMESRVISASAGEAYTCAIVNTRTSCWGDNYLGQLGDGTQRDRPTPVAVDYVVPSPEHPAVVAISPFPAIPPPVGTGASSSHDAHPWLAVGIVLMAAGLVFIALGRLRLA